MLHDVDVNEAEHPVLPRLPFELPTEEVIKANCSLSAP